MRLCLLGFALLLITSCARPLLWSCPTSPSPRDAPVTARVSSPSAWFEVTCAGEDVSALGFVSSALIDAAARTTRWGSFRREIAVRVVPDHAALEAAADRANHPWLRGWAFADLILIQSPRSLGAPSEEALRSDLRELLTHELTHVLMYQAMEPGGLRGLLAVAEPDEPPLWFREGVRAAVEVNERPASWGTHDV